MEVQKPQEKKDQEVRPGCLILGIIILSVIGGTWIYHGEVERRAREKRWKEADRFMWQEGYKIGKTCGESDAMSGVYRPETAGYFVRIPWAAERIAQDPKYDCTSGNPHYQAGFREGYKDGWNYMMEKLKKKRKK